MITIEHLSRRYGRHLAVDDVSFTVPPGSVTGFLGPNGAGKSTTLRALLGLTRPTAGRATIDDRTYAALPNPTTRVGVLLDAGALHGGRTGVETLRAAARTIGAPPERVAELLALVDLSPGAARRRVRSYSLGMRQRLGLALALLGDPQALVLDEPVNGLDPFGIAWLRDVLADFAHRGGAVLLSSHLIAEVEAIADAVVLIDRGRVVAQGRTADLLPGRATLARTDRPEVLAAALRRAGFGVQHDREQVVAAAPPARVAAAARATGVRLSGLGVQREQGLEELFLTRTGAAATALAVAA